MSRYTLFKKIRAIRQYADRVNPDPVWADSVRSTLLMQVKNSLPTRERRQQISLNERFSYLIPQISWVWIRQPASVVAVLILAIFGGSMYSVSAAERSLPGDVLYSVKLAKEQARMALAKNPAERVKLKSEFTDRRVDEVKQVMASDVTDKKERVVQAAEVLKRDMHTLQQQLDEVKQADTPETVKEWAKLVDEKTATVVQVLQDTKNGLSPEDKAKVTDAQAAASDTSIKAIEILADVHAQAADVVTIQDVTNALKSHNETVTKTMANTIQNTTTSTLLVTTATTTTSDAASLTQTTSTHGVIAAVLQADVAQKSLEESEKLAEESKINEAVVKLKQGTQQAFVAQKSLEQTENNVPLVSTDVLPTATPTQPMSAASTTTKATTTPKFNP